jgi:hypothetical protein
MRGRTALLALAGVAACAESRPPGGPTLDHGGFAQPCTGLIAPKALANIGPDLTLRATCGSTTKGAVASISETAGGFLSWTAAITGAPAFALEKTTFLSCETIETPVAFVDFKAPTSAEPGDAFDAVVTISAADGSFPSGTVKVHGEVTRAVASVDHPTVDFGEVEILSLLSTTLVFHNESTVSVSVAPPASAPPFLYEHAPVLIASQRSAESVVTFEPTAEGDASAVATFTVTPYSGDMGPATCNSTITVSLHARVVASLDAGAGASSDADAGN